MIGEFKAVYVSHRRVYIGSRIRRTREWFGLDCKFAYMHGKRSFTVRILKDNPVIKGLQRRTAYRFQEVGQIGFKAIKHTVTDMQTGTVYRMEKA